MTTNGYYGETKREFIAKHFDSILLSLDGPPYIQNFQRPTRLQGRSYDLIKETVKYFVDNVKSFAIRSTISNKSVNRMTEIVDFFCSEFGNKYHLVFEPLISIGRASYKKEVLDEPSKYKFAINYIKAKIKAKELGIELRNSSSNHKRLVNSFCGSMSIPGFIVTTKGVVTTCDRDSEGESYGYGRFDNQLKEFVFSESRKEQNKKLLELPSKCLNCFCKWHCAGDCPDVRTISYDRCFVNRKITLFELESLLTNPISSHA
jgi:uncharacterized protein